MQKHRSRCFFFIVVLFLRGGEGVFCPHLDFRYAKIIIIFHIYNFLELNELKRNTGFHPTSASWTGCLSSHPPFMTSEGQRRVISAISWATSSR